MHASLENLEICNNTADTTNRERKMSEGGDYQQYDDHELKITRSRVSMLLLFAFCALAENIGRIWESSKTLDTVKRTISEHH